MKRLGWLFLIAFGTLLAQVPPVDVRLVPAQPCDCCGEPGACGMPDCAPPPISSQPVLQLNSPAGKIRAAAPRTAPAPAGPRDSFYAQFVTRVRPAPTMPSSESAAHAAS